MSLERLPHSTATVEYAVKHLAESYGMRMEGDDGMYGMRTFDGMRWRFSGFNKHGEKVYGYISIDEAAFRLPTAEFASFIAYEVRSLAASILNENSKPSRANKKGPAREDKALVKLENELGEISP